MLERHAIINRQTAETQIRLTLDLDVAGRLIGTLDTELVQEFFKGVAVNARMTLPFLQHRGGNAHHVAEAAFKAFGRALDQATRRDERVQGVPSTKGVL